MCEFMHAVNQRGSLGSNILLLKSVRFRVTPLSPSHFKNFGKDRDAILDELEVEYKLLLSGGK
jgi:hypothetical protein